MWWPNILSLDRKNCDVDSAHSDLKEIYGQEGGEPHPIVEESDDTIEFEDLENIHEKLEKPSRPQKPGRTIMIPTSTTSKLRTSSWMAMTILLLVLSMSPHKVRATDLCPDTSCGDGFVGANEMCDDKNIVDGDGCSSQCTIECGYSCMTLWGAPCGNVSSTDLANFDFFNSTCLPELGDGILTHKERDEGARTFDKILRLPCDDGNIAAGDGCECFLPPRGQNLPRSFQRGCFVEDRWKCETDRTPFDLQCSAQLRLPDRCDCISSPTEVTLQRVPLLNIPERQFMSYDGFTGASPQVGCQVCNANHYTGGCMSASTFCLGHVTCNGNGFCDGDAQCVCWGNYTGTNCDRCIKDHYGTYCNKVCIAEETCGAHGYCDIDGNCLWNAFCDGIKSQNISNKSRLEVVNSCGDGRRLGNEECDDGNRVNFDGCSSVCKVEPGFKCIGGCQANGDVQRL
jgi:cysteine-rich repeat protein